MGLRLRLGLGLGLELGLLALARLSQVLQLGKRRGERVRLLG